MIKVTTKIFCDRCKKDITNAYAGDLKILVRDERIEEVEPEGKTFCKKCMMSFREWMKKGE